MKGITSILKLNSIDRANGCIILRTNIVENEMINFTRQNFIDVDNNRKIDFFKNCINKEIEIKIYGKNILEFYQSIKERYLDKNLFYIEIEKSNNLLRFWDYIESDSGQNDMSDLEYEKVELT